MLNEDLSLSLSISHTHTVEQGQANIAIELAEQYQHFPTLVQICEHQKNRERLETYFTKFGSDGFGEFLFKYYLDNGKTISSLFIFHNDLKIRLYL